MSSPDAYSAEHAGKSPITAGGSPSPGPRAPEEPPHQAGPGSDRKHRRLGRGLASLISIPPAGPDTSVAPGRQPDRHAPDGLGHHPTAVLANLAVATIQPNPFQPRRHFDEAALASLADSIRANGLVQPVLVRRHRDASAMGDEPCYQLIAGERRWRAARLAGLDSVPAIVKPVDDHEALELALIENIQRADLNPVERAQAYRAMLNSRQMNQEELAKRLGENRASIANYLRLLDLPEDVQDLLTSAKLTFGHARTILALKTTENQRKLAKAIVAHAWSVRQIEEFVGELLQAPAGETELDAYLQRASSLDPTEGKAKSRPRHVPPAKAPNIVSLEEKLTRRLGTRVSIHQGRRADLGKVVIEFYCLDDFDRILEAIGVLPD